MPTRRKAKIFERFIDIKRSLEKKLASSPPQNDAFRGTFHIRNTPCAQEIRVPGRWGQILECCGNTFLKKLLPSAKKSKLPSHQGFGVFALKVNKILQATPSKLRREMGMCATTIYVQQQQQYYAIRVLVVRTPVSSLSFQVQHTWYIRPGRHAHEPGTSSASCCCNGSVG